MRTLLSVFAFLLISMQAIASDYVLMRAIDVGPGVYGVTGSVFKVFVSLDSTGAEFTELHAAALTADTCTVKRVTGDLKITNTVAVLDIAASSVYTSLPLAGSNYVTLAQTGMQRDFFRCEISGTNTVRLATYQKIH